MKRVLRPYQLKFLGKQFVIDFCARNQITFTPHEKADSLNEEFVVWDTGLIAPTGNLSAMLHEVSIEFTFFNAEEDAPSLFRAQVKWSYNKVTGGAVVGKVDYLIQARKATKTSVIPDYEGYCEENLAHNIVSTFACLPQKIQVEG